MTTITSADLQYSTDSKVTFRAAWDACTSKVFLVLAPETGDNMANAKCRHLDGKYYLYVDDVDGFSIIEQDKVESLTLEAE